MNIVRTFLWVVILTTLLVFAYFNWQPIEITLWDNLVIETKVPALVILSFLLGLTPMWLLYSGTKWRLKRRIKALESAARSAALGRHSPAPQTAAPQPAPGPEPTPASEAGGDTPAPHSDNE